MAEIESKFTFSLLFPESVELSFGSVRVRKYWRIRMIVTLTIIVRLHRKSLPLKYCIFLQLMKSALFWLLYQMSQLFGNLYVFFAWQGKDEIDPTSRITLFSILVGFGSLGLIAFGFIKVRGRNKFYKV